MEQFRSTYSIFLNELKDFVDHLLTIYRRDGAPAILQNMKLVPTVLPEDDRDFDTMNKKGVCMKTQIVLQATRVVLQKVNPYIRKAVKADFEKESRKLEWRMGIVEMSLGSLTMQRDVSQVLLLSGGMSSINTGVRGCISTDTLIKLTDMCTKLQ